MMEKRNRLSEKRAAGDSRDLDDIVDTGARRFAKPSLPRRDRGSLPDPVMPAEPLDPEVRR